MTVNESPGTGRKGAPREQRTEQAWGKAWPGGISYTYKNFVLRMPWWNPIQSTNGKVSLVLYNKCLSCVAWDNPARKLGPHLLGSFLNHQALVHLAHMGNWVGRGPFPTYHFPCFGMFQEDREYLPRMPADCTQKRSPKCPSSPPTDRNSFERIKMDLLGALLGRSTSISL